MNPLATWMERNHETDATLASKLGVSRAHVSRLRRGKNVPSLATAKRLEAITYIPWPRFVESELQATAQ